MLEGLINMSRNEISAQDPRIRIICAYFGKMPSSFLPWLKSVEWNSSIHFILITDQDISTSVPNLEIVVMKFEELRHLFNRKLGQSVSLEYPYKLCDYKPFYGLVFSDYLFDCDYWGHCDMDLVFGDIRYFTRKYDLQKYDKFLTLGHLSLYRNTEENNRRFLLDGSMCGSWQDVISESKGHAFDEMGGIYQIYKKNGFPMFDEVIYADISSIYHRFRVTPDEKSNYHKQVFYWAEGKVFRDYWIGDRKQTEEYIYIHFKKRRFPPPPFDVFLADEIYVGPSGYSMKNGISTLEDVSKVNPYQGWIHEKLELGHYYARYSWNRLKKKLQVSDNGCR